MFELGDCFNEPIDRTTVRKIIKDKKNYDSQFKNTDFSLIVRLLFTIHIFFSFLLCLIVGFRNDMFLYGFLYSIGITIFNLLLSIVVIGITEHLLVHKKSEFLINGEPIALGEHFFKEKNISVQDLKRVLSNHQNKVLYDKIIKSGRKPFAFEFHYMLQQTTNYQKS